MRLVAGVLALTLFAPFVRAEEPRAPESPESPESPEFPRAPRDATPGKVPFRVVRVMPGSHQALLFDRMRATHVLAEVGAKIGGYTVEAIDADEVTLRFESKQIVLVAPARGGNRRQDGDRGEVPLRSASAGTPADAKADPMPVDPYGEPAIRTVQAPGTAERDNGGSGSRSNAIEPGEGGVRVVSATRASGASGASSPSSPSGAEQPSSSSAAGSRGEPASSLPIVAGEDGVRVVAAPGRPAPAASATPAATVPFPVDAYADAPTASGSAPLTTVTIVRASDARAPVDAYADDPATSAAPTRQSADARALADILAGDRAARGAPTPAPALARAGSASTSGPGPGVGPRPATLPHGAVLLSRVEVDSALDDFAKLTTALRGSFSANGVVIDDVRDGSIFHRAGLRAGDVVTVIDGARLRSLDDAANLYARASSAKAITAQILRAGKSVTLHLVIQ